MNAWSTFTFRDREHDSKMTAPNVRLCVFANERLPFLGCQKEPTHYIRVGLHNMDGTVDMRRAALCTYVCADHAKDVLSQPDAFRPNIRNGLYCERNPNRSKECYMGPVEPEDQCAVCLKRWCVGHSGDLADDETDGKQKCPGCMRTTIVPPPPGTVVACESRYDGSLCGKDVENMRTQCPKCKRRFCRSCGPLLLRNEPVHGDVFYPWISTCLGCKAQHGQDRYYGVRP
jgi:hypothetical protein